MLAEGVCAKLGQVAHVVPQAAHAHGDVELCAGNSEGVFPHAVQRAFALAINRPIGSPTSRILEGMVNNLFSGMFKKWRCGGCPLRRTQTGLRKGAGLPVVFLFL